MRILRVHNRYQQRGGEDVSFEAEVALLEREGHDLKLLEFNNEGLLAQQSITERARLAITTIWSQPARELISSAIQSHATDVVHFDNTFPLVSPGAYSVCQQHGVAVVQSLRNYRLLCPTATFYRDGRPCEDCLGKTPPLPGVIHGCYRNSRAQSAVVAAMLTTHRLRRTWTREVDHYVALSKFARDRFVEGGLPPERVSVKPNFVDLPYRGPDNAREGMLYVGRLTPEKGIGTLINAWTALPGVKLTIVGDGPMQINVAAGARDHRSITYLGRQRESDTYRIMALAEAIVVPSEWYEPFGRVVIEGFANGTPSIVSRSGGLSELVSDGRTGLLFEPGNEADLAAKVRWAADHPEEMRRMGEAARIEYETKYTPQRNYSMLMNIYTEAINHSNKRLTV